MYQLIAGRPVSFGGRSTSLARAYRLVMVGVLVCGGLACQSNERCTAIIESSYPLTPSGLDDFPRGRLFRDGSRLILEWNDGGVERRAVWRIDAEGSVEYR